MHIPAPPGYEGRPPREWPVPAMDHSAGGVASAYTPEMGRLLLARILAGETVKQITADRRAPSYATVYRWVHMHPDFADGWLAARRRLARRAIARDLEARANRAGQRALEEGLGLRPRRGPGRRSSYTTAKGNAVCERIRDGWTVSRITATAGLPSAKAIYRWLKVRPAFRAAFVDACQFRLDMLQHDIWDAAERGPAAAREIAYLEGRMGRLTPKTYRVQL